MLVKTIDFYESIFSAYPHQKEFIRAFFSGEYHYFMEKLHRRAGKDAEAFNAIWLYACMIPGNYLYTLPKIAQARNVIWEGKSLSGQRWVDAIPRHLIKSFNQSQCKIYFKNGSILHITGADSLMTSHLGSNLKGICMSEYHKTNPAIWDYLRPILKRSKGWAMFLFTAYAKGHAFRLMQSNMDNPQWWCRSLTVDETRDNEGKYIFSPEDIEEERRSGMDEALIQQEYYCSEEAAIKGTFFTEQIDLAYREGRIKPGVEVNPHLPVFTSWDIGSRDTNSIWWFQKVGEQFVYFHQHDKNYGSIDYYLQLLEQIRIKYQFHKYGGHFLPHDVSHTEWTSGKTRQQVMRERGMHVIAVPRLKVMERVQVARSAFKHVIIDSVGCKNGLEALTVARSVWDEARRSFIADEEHDWSSHPSASFQYGLTGWYDSYAKQHLQRVQSYARTYSDE